MRTASILLMKYTDGQNKGHVAFRRLIRRHFSLVGQPGRPQLGPLCAGSWNVNPLHHPDGLNDVARAAQENGMQLLLWIEPERAFRSTDSPNEPSEWYIDIGENSLLLNLSDENALQWVIEMVAEKIERLHLGCYRQDFNVSPLDYWHANDEEGRAGLTKLKYIENLYRFWAALLARFPYLIIDNCASGGRRIDNETLSRSIPLWRSDYQCAFDADAEAAQLQNTGISWWLPYSGTGVGHVMG